MLNPTSVDQTYQSSNMVEVDRVWPSGLRYDQVNPEAISSDIKLVTFTPQQTVNFSKGNDVIKFTIQNDGFFDPYSAYFRIQVNSTPANTGNMGEIRFLDRSAHSFIQRMVIRSNGVEIERLENYDVMSAMINDMIYSPEQAAQHHWEGFAGKCIQGSPWQSRMEGQYSFDNEENMRFAGGLLGLLSPGASNWGALVGEHAFFQRMNAYAGDPADYVSAKGGGPSLDMADEVDLQGLVIQNNLIITPKRGANAKRTCENDLLMANGCKGGEAYSMIEKFTGDSAEVTTVDEAYNYRYAVPQVGVDPGPKGSWTEGNQGIIISGNTSREFIIPIYSGFLGVLMPIKKFIPLAFVPLEIEITLNPYALYSNYTYDEGGRRDYVIQKFDLVSHVVYFEQSIKNTIQNTIAQGGLYFHCNSFALAPTQYTMTGKGSIPPIVQIGMTQKSINSVHMLFYYRTYENETAARKLHFVSHNISSLQIRNGTTFLPSQPIQAAISNQGAGDTWSFSHVMFLVETYKAWGKLHQPATDAMITEWNWGIDHMNVQSAGLLSLTDIGATKTETIVDADGTVVASGTANSKKTTIIQQINWKHLFHEYYGKQALIGRTQYGISMEGEELGEDKSIISGRPARYPFDIAILGSKVETDQSYINIFLRYDYIVQVRPDLIIQVSGR